MERSVVKVLDIKRGQEFTTGLKTLPKTLSYLHFCVLAHGTALLLFFLPPPRHLLLLHHLTIFLSPILFFFIHLFNLGLNPWFIMWNQPTRVCTYAPAIITICHRSVVPHWPKWLIKSSKTINHFYANWKTQQQLFNNFIQGSTANIDQC